MTGAGAMDGMFDDADRASNAIDMGTTGNRFKTLNPVVGCPVGCRFCYARRIAEKYGMTDDFSQPRFFPQRVAKLGQRRPAVFFLDSMSDVAFWEEGWLHEVMDAVRENPQHEYLLLTKRPDRLVGCPEFSDAPWAWLGTTVTCAGDAWRLDALSQVDARHKAVSFEPLLGDVGHIDLSGIEWVMIGEETGPEANLHPVDPAWAWGIVRLAESRGIPVSVKAPLSLRRRMPESDGLPASMAAVLRGVPKPGFPSFDALLDPRFSP